MCGLIVKGPADIILVGKECYLNSINGSTKRCGGIGDILCGVCAQYWVFHNKTPSSISLANCFAGAVGLVRMASKAAQKERGLSLTAPFIINKLHEVWDIVEKSK
jgi:NAD(P)H-hydrate repair Nnr-like enzyme with NAD(P)H-hydrate dehydratase domain